MNPEQLRARETELATQVITLENTDTLGWSGMQILREVRQELWEVQQKLAAAPRRMED
jgi:hypothetical protein